MSIPLDNLYHWVEGLLPGPACVYVFRPHGSKKISDLDMLKKYDDNTCWQYPGIIMHDQEPLDWNLYNQPEQYLDLDRWKKWNCSLFQEFKLKYCANFNLKSVVFAQSGLIYDQVILIHSEKNSANLEKYQQNGFICIHYWSHAVIARDWYRFAKHDTRLNNNTNAQNKFLIYCRDWSHRREYRLKFLEMLAKNNLDNISQTSVMHTNSEGIHFLQHQFKNYNFELDSPELINQFLDNKFSSAASADYDPVDFTNSEISVILETVFDDSRIHLTEKTLKPIACGHPFILAAGPGALEYIRNYGFKTFAPWIDESYDQETDSFKRLEKIIASMKKIQNLQGQEFESFSREIKNIAEFNKKHFFSNEFFDQVNNELKNNLNMAMSQVTKSQSKHYLELVKLLKKSNLIDQMPHRQERTRVVRQLRQSCQDFQSNPQVDLSV
jgi:hypothetical protein